MGGIGADFASSIENGRETCKDAKVLDALYRLHPERATAFIAKKMKDLLSRSAAT